ncbi:ice-binding family protein [Mucilaginibacter lappiensis]|uniref:ice-binding family protein n=1 Tax=Mucilaginibacter lappiensis TaxID=354630 RepID=UPI003D201359
MKKIFISVLFVFIVFRLSAYTGDNHKFSTSKSPITSSKNIGIKGNRLIATTVVPDLGSAAGFALFTVAGAVGNTGISNITGNIGANVGAITGFGTSIVTGAIYNANSVTAQCAADLISAYNQLSAITSTAAHAAVFGNGETLYTGVYTVGAAGSAAGVLTLDAQGDANAVFIFKIGGAFTTGASTTVILTNGASAKNVFWVAEGAIAMAASTTMKGTLIANNDAISMGAGGSLEGRMFSTTGAVSVYGNNIYIPGSSGIGWIGFFSNNWNTAANWAGNVVPTSSDQAFIGVNQAFFNFPNIPASSGTVNVGSIKFGTLGLKAAGVVVNAGSTLNVLGAITYQSDAGSALNYTCTLSGVGTVKANSIAIIANTPIPLSPYTQIFASSVTNLNVDDNITLTSTVTGGYVLNSTFNVTGGTTLVNGIILTSNAAGNTSTFTVTPTTIATLQIANNAALSGLSALGTNVITFKNPGATVEYSGAAQIVYNDAAITGLSTGVNYQNIKFSGTGLKTLSVGNLNVAGNFTNALTNDVSNNLNLLNNTVKFNGTTQSLAGGTGLGTIFNNVAFSGAGTKNMVSGNFYVGSSGVLTMSGNSPSTILNAGGFLTLNSDALGSASIARILTGPGITGNVNVQRYFKAQASGATADNTRNYRLLSSPVNSGSGAYSLSYLNANSGNLTGIFVSGPTGPAGGFTVTNATPTIYLHNESLTTSTSSFSGGNFKGLTNISGNTLTYYNSSGTATANTTLPVGNGFLLYYVGNNINNVTSATALNKQYRFGGSYIAPDAATSTATGVLNQGAIAVKLWWNGGTVLSDAKTGYNLIGNPYASTIDWDQYSAGTNTAGIYAPLVSPTMYVFNYSNKNYGSYLAGTPGGTGTNNASRYIASSQGFFIMASVSSGASLTFNETAKTVVQPTNSLLLFKSLATPIALNQLMRIKLSKDAVNTDDIMILFEPDSKNEYEPYHDADRLSGIGNVTTLASYGYDSEVLLAINRMRSIDTVTRVKLYVNISKSVGVDTLSASGLSSLDPRFDIYLIDHYKKDSLMISRYPQYLFNITDADPSSFGANRFEIVFHKKSSLNYKLLGFTASPVAKGVLLTWRTQNENNLTGFSIERKDGSTRFVALNQMQSNGSGIYTYIDSAPLTGVSYYRLKQNDAFDVVSYSKIIAVNKINISSEILTLYPNPATSKFTIIIHYDIPSKAIIRITDAGGRTQINRQTEGDNIQQVVNDLMPGVYLVEVIDAGTKKLIGAKKLIKK